MVRYTLIAPVGGDLQALFVGLREFPTKKLVLLYTRDKRDKIPKIKESLEAFRLPIEAHELGDNLLGDAFNVMRGLGEKVGELLVNTSAGDASLASIVLSVANVLGIKAFAVVGDTPIVLPTFKLDMARIVSKKKAEILKALAKGPLRFSELKRRVRLSAPLLSYHLNGDRKSEGLVSIGLVEVQGGPKNRVVSLSSLGRLLTNLFDR